MQAALLLLLSVVAGCPKEPGDYEAKIHVCGVNRKFLFHLPPCYDGCRRLPVVFVFHGMSANAKLVQKFSEMDATADKYGFITVYPEGSGFSVLKSFKAGGTTMARAQNKPDDVAFVDAIIDDLQRGLCIDCDRIYATGLSNGAMMCHRLAVELPHRITAIAPISGTLGTDVCPPQCPIPIMQFQGTCDEVLPIDGPRESGLFSIQTFYPLAQTMQFYAAAAECKGEPKVTQLPDCYDDGTIVRIHEYVDCKPGIEVILVEICGGGHQWPRHGLPFRYLGATTQEIDANEMMWCFFQRHTLSERGCHCGCVQCQAVAKSVAKSMEKKAPAATARLSDEKQPVSSRRR